MKFIGCRRARSWIAALSVAGLSLFTSAGTASALECEGLSSAQQTNWGGTADPELASEFLVLLDSSGSLAKNVNGYPAPDQGITYWRRLISKRLPQWLTGPRLTAGGPVHVLLYGVSYGSDWQRDFLRLHRSASGTEGAQAVVDAGGILLSNRDSRSNWGVSSASNPAALRGLADCRQRQGGVAATGGLRILNITDNETNRSARTPELNEIQSTTRSDDAPSGAKWLWRSIVEVNDHYNYTSKTRRVLFPPNIDTVDESDETLFGDCRACGKSVNVTLIEVVPAIPLDPAEHLLLSRAVQTETTAEGYRARITFERRDATASPYRLERLCVEIGDQRECRPGNQALSFELKFKDDTAVPRPDQLKVSGWYRYSPPNADLGLTIVNHSAYPITKAPPTLDNEGHEIKTADLREYPDLTADEVAKIRNQKLAVRDGMIRAALIMLGALAMAGLAVLWNLRQSRHPTPHMVLTITDGPPPENSVESGAVVVDGFDTDLPVATETRRSVGYVHLVNRVKPNRRGHHETLRLQTVSVELVEVTPAEVLAGAAPNEITPFRLAYACQLHDIGFSRETSWPLFVLPAALPGLHDVDFPDGRVFMRGRISVTYRYSRWRRACTQTRSLDFSVTVEVSPSPYAYSVKMELSHA